MGSCWCVPGKREIGNTSAFDLIVALILGEVVDEIICGDVTILQVVTAIVVVGVWHLANSWARHPLCWSRTARSSTRTSRGRDSMKMSFSPNCACWSPSESSL